MTSTEARIPMSRVMKDVTSNVEVTGLRIWWLRQTIGVALIKLAARVMGVGIRVDTEKL